MRRLFVLVVSVGLFVGLLAGPAAADKPIVEVGSDSFSADVFGAVAECGAPIVTDIDVSYTLVIRFPKDGAVQVTDHLVTHATLTNTDNGKTTKINQASTAHVTIGAGTDGRDTVKITGLQGHVVAPGSGAAAQDSGQLVIEAFGPEDEDPIFVTAHGLFEGMGGPYPELCEVLT